MKKRIVCLILCLACLLTAVSALADTEQDWILGCRFKVLRTTDAYLIVNDQFTKVGTVTGGTYCRLPKAHGMFMVDGVSYIQILYREGGQEKIVYIRMSDRGSCMKLVANANGMSEEVHELLYNENATGTWTYYVKNDGAKALFAAEHGP